MRVCVCVCTHTFLCVLNKYNKTYTHLNILLNKGNSINES